jgi:Skp family chaperone for outer membrane proteins
MTLLILKDWFSKVWVWLKKYWWVVLIIVVFLTSAAFAGVKIKNLYDLNQIEQESHQQEVSILNQLHEEELIQRDELLKEYEVKITKIEEEYQAKVKELEEQSKKRIRGYTRSYQEDPTKFAGSIAEQLGVVYVP